MNLEILAYNEARVAKLAAEYGAMPAAIRIFNSLAPGPFTVPFNCMMDMLLVGGGASGGMTYSNGNVGGAGAGEVAFLYGKVFQAGAVLQVWPGQGGIPVTRSTAGQTPGAVGSLTEVIHEASGFHLAAHGGQPGNVGAAGSFQAGGAGGTGGGTAYPVAGALHFAGGDGGSSSSTTVGVGGGGAANILGWSDPAAYCTGGLLTAGSGGAGGAGVGGKGGEKNTATASSFSAGGGSGGSASAGLSSAATAGVNAVGISTQASVSSLASIATTFGLDYFGGGGYTAVAPGPGGGSSGDLPANLKASGIFGGMGGAFNGSTTINVLPQAGLGGGGAGLHVSAGATWASGRGGGGLVVFVLRRLPT